jgi:hypothetical protein
MPGYRFSNRVTRAERKTSCIAISHFDLHRLKCVIARPAPEDDEGDDPEDDVKKTSLIKVSGPVHLHVEAETMGEEGYYSGCTFRP